MLGTTATANGAVLVLGTGVPAVLLRVLAATAISLLLVLGTVATDELLLTAIAGLVQDSA